MRPHDDETTTTPMTPKVCPHAHETTVQHITHTQRWSQKHNLYYSIYGQRVEHTRRSDKEQQAATGNKSNISLRFLCCYLKSSLSFPFPTLSFSSPTMMESLRRQATFSFNCRVRYEVQSLWAAWVIQAGQRRQFFLRRHILQSFPIVWIPFLSIIILMSAFSHRWGLVMRMVDHFPRTVFVACGLFEFW